MSAIVRRLLSETFGEHAPPRLDALLPEDVDTIDPLSFKAAPILAVGTERPHRAYVSAVGEPEAFRTRVGRVLGPRAEAFLREVGPEVRSFADIGPHAVELFHDDLHEHGYTDPLTPPDTDLMCRSRRWPDGAPTVVTRHTAAPRSLLDEPWLRRADDLLHHGLVGLVGVRWAAGGVRSLLWINDVEHAEDTARNASALDGCHPLWDSLRAIAHAEGLRAYPDSIEVLPNGDWDVTVGLVSP